MIIVSDIDEVLTQTIEAMLSRLRKEFKCSYKFPFADIIEFDVGKSVWPKLQAHGYEQQHLLGMLEHYWNDSEFYADLKPYAETINYLIYLYDEDDATLHFVSARPEFLMPVTLAWLQKYLPAGSVTSTQIHLGLWGIERVEKIVALKPDIYMDDDAKTATRVARARPETAVSMPVRPWNSPIRQVGYP